MTKKDRQVLMIMAAAMALLLFVVISGEGNQSFIPAPPDKGQSQPLSNPNSSDQSQSYD